MRRAAKIDANQPDIVTVWRDLGYSVKSLAPMGHGFPDLITGGLMPCPNCHAKIPQNLMTEVKDGTLPPSRRMLTPDEQNFHALWRGPIVIVESVEDALRAVGAIEGKI